MAIWHRQYSTYSFEILWRAAMTTLELAEKPNEHVRKDHLSIQSLLSGFLAFEGFVNFVGEEVAPQIWKAERTYFSSDQYRGIVGKVEFLYSIFPSVTLKKGEEPYQTFYRIKKIRDNLAHNKVLKYAEITENEYLDFKTSWDEFDTPGKVRPALIKLKSLAESIRVETLKILIEEYPLSHLHFPALEGPLGDAEGTTAPN